MNYSDFEKIEQDEWSLTRPTFPTTKGGTLTVVGWSGRMKDSTKNYIVECSLCKGDKELNGEGVYRCTKSKLSIGNIPCNCSKTARLTKAQWEIRVKRIAEEKGLKFISFVGEFRNQNTKLELRCPEHGSWDTTTVTGLVNKGAGCPTCGRSRIRESEKQVGEFMATGKFHGDTKFWRDEKKNSKAHSTRWFYKCPVCSSDEYVKAGVCNGVFEAQQNHLKNGKLACRCSKSPKYTEEQWTFRMEKETKEKGYTFVRWLGKVGQDNKFEYLCPLHGIQETIPGRLLTGCGCSGCAGQDQQQCYINQVLDEDLVIAIKFGMAKDSSSRMKRLNSKNLFKMRRLGVWEFPSVKSCKGAENQCKKELDCSILTKRELADGHTETTLIKNLDRIIEIYENHGGKRINTNEER